MHLGLDHRRNLLCHRVYLSSSSWTLLFLPLCCKLGLLMEQSIFVRAFLCLLYDYWCCLQVAVKIQSFPHCKRHLQFCQSVSFLLSVVVCVCVCVCVCVVCVCVRVCVCVCVDRPTSLTGNFRSSHANSAVANYVLLTAFPRKELTDMGQSLQEAQLLNAVITQRMK